MKNLKPEVLFCAGTLCGIHSILSAVHIKSGTSKSLIWVFHCSKFFLATNMLQKPDTDIHT